MYEEAKDALDYQVQISTDLDDKAARIFRFNALILTVLVTGLSIAATSQTARDLATTTTVYTLVAALTLVVTSALFALIAYQTTELEISLNVFDMRDAATEAMDEATLYKEALETYAEEAYAVNDDRLTRIATWFQVSMLALWAGLAVLLSAAFSILHDYAAWGLLVVSAIGLIAVGFQVGLYG